MPKLVEVENGDYGILKTKRPWYNHHSLLLIERAIMAIKSRKWKPTIPCISTEPEVVGYVRTNLKQHKP